MYQVAARLASAGWPPAGPTTGRYEPVRRTSLRRRSGLLDQSTVKISGDMPAMTKNSISTDVVTSPTPAAQEARRR